jgi:hypothetical protein
MTELDPIALITGATLPTAVVPVCFATHLVTRYEQAKQELADTARQAVDSDSLAAGPPAHLRTELLDLEQQIRANTIDLTLRAMPSKTFKTLKRDHPPRKDDDGRAVPRDQMLGVNEATFFDPLLRACLIQPALDEATFRILVDERLTDGQLEKLTTAAWFLNVRVVDAPFSSAASPTTTPSASG